MLVVLNPLIAVRPHPFVWKVNMIRKRSHIFRRFVLLIRILIENEVAINGINFNIMLVSFLLDHKDLIIENVRFNGNVL